MRVSVIIPVFNSERTLPDLLQALAAQTYPTELTEVLCIDNNSTGRIDQILKQCSVQKVSHLTCSRQSSYAARNVGIAHAQGDILAFTDADCRPTPDWLKAGVKQMMDESLDRLGGAVCIPITAPVSVWALLDASVYQDQETCVEQGWAPTSNLLIRRTVIDQVGVFNEALISGGDSEFGCRCMSAGISISYSTKALVIHPPRTQAIQIVKKSRRIGLGHAQLAAKRLPVASRRPWQKQRRLFEKRLGRLSLSLWRRFLLQFLKYITIDLVRKSSYLWGRWVLQQRGVEDILSSIARSENSSNP